MPLLGGKLDDEGHFFQLTRRVKYPIIHRIIVSLYTRHDYSATSNKRGQYSTKPIVLTANIPLYPILDARPIFYLILYTFVVRYLFGLLSLNYRFYRY
jgi:hypothetical protein